ncbi:MULTISPECIES: hypothetical protein [Micromonospora]|uniref:hypothetical protein n=1 Tax=Micromonospora TaxID=1873 RepID=UPI001B38324A|nr:hypothetical protein [Micromonospora sp. D75]MBQ1068077.1 hypothetical protein [Micromonospora sp. D75]
MSELIGRREDRLSAASHETVRSAITGIRVPRWETVHDIVVALAGLCSPPRNEKSETARFLTLWRAIGEGESGALKSFQELVNGGWGGEDGKWTPELVMGVLINPFSAIEIHPSLAAPHEPLISEDQWVHGMAQLIEEQGVEHAMRVLLLTLKGDYVGADEGVPYGYGNPDREALEAYAAYQYGCQEILRRLGREPNLLAESIRAMRADESMDREDRAEMLENESDLSLMREVMIVTPDTWDEVSEEAHQMVFGYLIKQISPVGTHGLPDDERFRIIWRIPESPAA